MVTWQPGRGDYVTGGCFAGVPPPPGADGVPNLRWQDWYHTTEELAQPLVAIYWSLWECGGGMIADGRLLDLIR